MASLLDTKIETRRYIYPGQSNADEVAHGGDLVKWIEQSGAMSAMRFAGNDTVTVGIDNVRFTQPIAQGSIALLEAFVVESGTSSVTAHVRCFDENRYTGERDLAVVAETVSVAIDEDGAKVTVPELRIETDEGQRLYDAATA